jgi:hypothetical protein
MSSSSPTAPRFEGRGARRGLALAALVLAAASFAPASASSSSTSQLYCWGSSMGGRLGAGGNAPLDTAALMPVARDALRWTSLSAGAGYTCGTDTSNAVYCWGEGLAGNLGYGGKLDHYVPVPVPTAGTLQSPSVFRHPSLVPASLTTSKAPALDDAAAAALGIEPSAPHSCGIDNAGQLHCWGYGPAFAGSSAATTIPLPTPIPLAPPPTSDELSLANVTAANIGAPAGATVNATVRGWISVTAGRGFTCGIAAMDIGWTLPSRLLRLRQMQATTDNATTDQGTGSNTSTTSDPSTTPTPQASSTMTGSTSSAASVSGTASPIPTPSTSEIGTPSNSPTPSASPAPALSHAPNGYCWGSAILGIGASTPYPIPGGHAFVQLSAGVSHVCGVDVDGDAWCWGVGSNGQLGNNATNVDSSVPLKVMGGRSWSRISAGARHTCGVEAGTGDAYCWGSNLHGRLGVYQLVPSDADIRLPGRVATVVKFVSISVGFSHTCGLSSDGGLYCWGEGTNFRHGCGTTLSQRTPCNAQGYFFNKFKSVDAGSAHTCAISTEDKAYCWGAGYRGALGFGYLGNTRSVQPDLPTAVSALPTQKNGWPLTWDSGVWGGEPLTYTAGGSHSCGIAINGTAFCPARLVLAMA